MNDVAPLEQNVSVSDSPYEPAIRAALAGVALSPSHGFEHLDRVAAFALALQQTYGGDRDVIMAAALLHDLGRSDTNLRGPASAEESARRAAPILAAIGFPAEKTPLVLQAIAEHDQPELRPSSIEGRILKDADFLAGFGAQGIVRSAFWTAESGGSQADFIDRLERKMAARLASLEFEQSRHHAQREYLFVRLFLDRLRQPPALRAVTTPYVVFEGISGSGKSTQVALLEDHYRRVGRDPLSFHEPSPWYRRVRQELGVPRDDAVAQTLLLLVDRYQHGRPIIEQARAAGRPIIAARSYLSTLVYQAREGGLAPANIASLHAVLPQPTAIFLLDIAPEEALRRIEARSEAAGEHETAEQMAIHRQRFLALPALFPEMRALDAGTLDPQALHAHIWSLLNEED